MSIVSVADLVPRMARASSRTVSSTNSAVFFTMRESLAILSRKSTVKTAFVETAGVLVVRVGPERDWRQCSQDAR
jgi:hypothetical protein